MAFLNRCCGCGVGKVIPKWVRDTTVRDPADTGPTPTATPPFGRKDTGTWNSEHTHPNLCSDLAPGFCGTWLVAGDLNGVVGQQNYDTVDDIIPCAAPDATHVTIDHNCYRKSGTIDMSSPKLFGALWVMAQKYWHGVFGWNNNDACAKNPNIAPSQTKYRTVTVTLNLSSVQNNFETAGQVNEIYATAAGSQTISRFTGIKTNSVVTTQDQWDTASSGATRTHNKSISAGAGFDKYIGNRNYNAGQSTIIDTLAVGDYHCTTLPTTPSSGYDSAMDLAGIVANWNDTAAFIAANPDLFPDASMDTLPAVTDPDNYSGTAKQYSTSTPANVSSQIGITWSRSETSFTWNFTQSHRNPTNPDDFNGDYSFTGSLTLSDPYTAADCYEDFKALLAAWNMSDMDLAKFRTDELLALISLCLFDEVGGAGFSFVPATMDNYASTFANDYNGNVPGSTAATTGQHDAYGRAPGDPGFTGGVDYITTWPQRAWIDPNDYRWKNPGNGLQGVPGIGGCILKTPLRTGEIIAHTQAGSERHWWPGSPTQKRVSDGSGGYIWVTDENGEYTPSELPPVSMRWLDKFTAQYDGLAHFPHTGNFPQAFLTQQGGVLRGAKFVQATQKWPSVNFGRPCGLDKYSILQSSVCCVADFTAGVFTVKKTGEAADPATTGGLQINDYIVADSDGVYRITDIIPTTPDGDGNAQWLVSVGSQLDTLPTGFVFGDGMDVIGTLRFPSAPGICGRAAITTTFSTPTLTITAALALPYLRLDPATGTILVDLYDASMTLLTGGGGLALTRVSDTVFTATHAALATAVWMTGHGVDWTKYNATPKKTGVHFDWTFNTRPLQTGFTGTVPTWYAGVGGCLNGVVTQFTYSAGACPAAIGIVPFYSPPADTSGDLPVGDDVPPANEAVESFPNQELFDFPAVFLFDDIYQAHWQAGVYLTMQDPFWQRPFKPDCDNSTFTWKEDDGTGLMDDDVSTPPVHYFAHHILVEALKDIPAGDSLPSGITLTYAHPIAPTFYPNGIPCDSGSGDYVAYEQDWGFGGRACANIGSLGRFSDIYLTFVSC